MCKCKTTSHPIPGQVIGNYDYHLVADRVFDQNREFVTTVHRHCTPGTEGRFKNPIEKKFGKLYDELISLPKNKDVTELTPPTITAIHNKSNNRIYTNIYVSENYHVVLDKKDFEIYQDFTIGMNGTPQLCYYICFRRSGCERKRGSSYRLHKFSIKSIDVKFLPLREQSKRKLDMKSIEKVMACVINVNPKTSRGTVTTVKSPV